jgi:hypothetical protein
VDSELGILEGGVTVVFCAHSVWRKPPYRSQLAQSVIQSMMLSRRGHEMRMEEIYFHIVIVKGLRRLGIFSHRATSLTTALIQGTTVLYVALLRVDRGEAAQESGHIAQ